MDGFDEKYLISCWDLRCLITDFGVLANMNTFLRNKISVWALFDHHFVTKSSKKTAKCPWDWWPRDGRAALFLGSVTSGPLAPERDRGLQHWECQYHPSSSIFNKRAVSFVSGSRMSGPDGEWRFACSLLVLMHFFATGQEDADTLLSHASLAVSPWDSRNQVRAASASTSGGHAPCVGHSSLPLLLHHGYLEFLLSWNGNGTMAHIGWLFPQFVIVFSALEQSLLFFG